MSITLVLSDFSVNIPGESPIKSSAGLSLHFRSKIATCDVPLSGANTAALQVAEGGEYVTVTLNDEKETLFGSSTFSTKRMSSAEKKDISLTFKVEGKVAAKVQFTALAERDVLSSGSPEKVYRGSSLQDLNFEKKDVAPQKKDASQKGSAHESSGNGTFFYGKKTNVKGKEFFKKFNFFMKRNDNFDKVINESVSVSKRRVDSKVDAVVKGIEEDMRTRLDEFRVEMESNFKELVEKYYEERTSRCGELETDATDAQKTYDEALEEFYAERDAFEKEREEAERKLREDREQLQQERDTFEAEKEMIRRKYGVVRDRIKLNIGGRIFETSKRTLLQFKGSLFELMVSGRHEVTMDEDGAFFFDRDHNVFKYILNFMRSGTLKVPFRKELWEEIREEASFYNITELVKFVDEMLQKQG